MGLPSQFILITSDEMSTNRSIKNWWDIIIVSFIYFLTCQNSVIFVFQAPLNATRSHYHCRLQVFPSTDCSCL